MARFDDDSRAGHVGHARDLSRAVWSAMVMWSFALSENFFMRKEILGTIRLDRHELNSGVCSANLRYLLRRAVGQRTWRRQLLAAWRVTSLGNRRPESH